MQKRNLQSAKTARPNESRPPEPKPSPVRYGPNNPHPLSPFTRLKNHRLNDVFSMATPGCPLMRPSSANGRNRT